MNTLSDDNKISILLETLPWLKRYAGKIVVIKYGGHAMADPALMRSFAEDVSFLHQWGIKPIVVHGGGPQINVMLDRLGLEAPFNGGLRVTTAEVMEIVRMVLIGKVQRELVSVLNEKEHQSIGLAGEDAGLFQARRIQGHLGGKNIDIGQVGEICHVNPTALVSLMDRGYIPVVSSVAPDSTDRSMVLNVNADAAATALAVAVGAEKLVFLSDVDGLYRDWPDPQSKISRITDAQLRELVPRLEAGMVPKMEAAIEAIGGGVPRVHLINGRHPHSMLRDIFSEQGDGTVITAERAEVFE